MSQVSSPLPKWMGTVRLTPGVLSSMLSSALIVGCQSATDPDSESRVRAAASRSSAVGENHALGFMVDFVQVADHPDLDLRHRWTVETWVYPRAVGTARMRI
jgi:hypothetical protein